VFLFTNFTLNALSILNVYLNVKKWILDVDYTFNLF